MQRQLTEDEVFALQYTRYERLLQYREIFHSENTPKSSEAALNKRLSVVDREYNDFRQTHDEISIAFPPHQRNQAYFKDQIHEKFIELFFTVYSEVETTLLDLIQQKPTSSTPTTNSTKPESELFTLLQNLQNNGQSSNIKLPTLSPPTFSGKYLDWNGFRDQFYALIDSNKKVAVVQKFQYLFAATSGRARDIIKHLPVAETSYYTAWELLEEKYENPRAIFTNAMEELQFFERDKKDTITGLQKLYSIIFETQQTMKNLNLNCDAIDPIIAYLSIIKLPPDTRKEFEKNAAKKRDLPNLESVTEQIQNAIRTLEQLEHQTSKDVEAENSQSKQSRNPIHKSLKSLHFGKSNSNKKGNSRPNSKLTSRASSLNSKKREYKCVMCPDQQHPLRFCPKFLELSAEERRNAAVKWKLCFNCLSNHHMKTECTSPWSCTLCGSRHHTLLHLPNESTSTSTHSEETSTTSKAIHTSKIDINAPIFRATLLATAIVMVSASDGSKIPMRALIDQGGEASAISESAIQLLKLKKQKCSINIDHLDNTQSKSKGFVSFEVQSCVSPFSIEIDALVLKSLVNRLPSREIHYSNWPHIKNLTLADPNFNQIGPIDMILGAEVYGEIVLADVRKGPKGTPTAQSTEFGWILYGKAYKNSLLSNVSINTLQVDELLKQFFEIGENSDEKMQSSEDQYVIDFFNQTIQRDHEGRFVITFPFRTPLYPDAVLGKSRDNALKHFLHLERKFELNPEFKAEYAKNINDYLLQGHMIELFDTECDRLYYTENGQPAYDCFYLPHHAVIKENSSSTRLRPVYNASKKSSNGNSLNSVLFPGPVLLNDLIAILINWRFHQIAFVGDIQQMYRQIRVADNHITYQRILWRNHPSEKLREYGINRLGFGSNYAPCGAIQCIFKLAEQTNAEFPESAEIIRRDTYMDDAITGSHDIETALRIMQELIQIFASAGFKIKKWASNSNDILASVPECDREINIPLTLYSDKKIKTLGILWNTSVDCLNFNFNYQEDGVITKQFVLSTIARIFDPLGLISPVTVMTKIFMKELWTLKLDWHDPLPPEHLRKWNVFIEKLPSLSSIQIPRWIKTSPKCSSYELHGFADASSKAYGGSIYLRCVSEKGEVTSNLIFSKSKVTPMKIQTIPRLELSAALILTKMVNYICKSIRHYQFDSSNIFFWTDSQVVLHWIRGNEKKWKVFVTNRIIKILEFSKPSQWHYIPSKENPADILSRGLNPSELNNNQLWFHGPSWLRQRSWIPYEENEIPDHPCLIDELKPISINTMEIVWTPTDYLLNYCSDYIQLLRYTSWYRRFFSFLKNKNNVQCGQLTARELNAAKLRWISCTQSEHFSIEMEAIRRKTNGKNRLSKLHPFIDKNNFLRVGGRLSFAETAFDEKHPFIMPHNNHFVKLIILHKHEVCLHAGNQLTLAETRKSFWILGGRRAVHHIIKKCVKCTIVRGETATQLMANLPPTRVTSYRPFLHTGVDLCGPVMIRTAKSRGTKVFKGYIVLFICLSVKAVHLEPVTDQSSEAFLMAFQRFIARRGMCSDLYMDCGTNFIGARRILKKDEEEYLAKLHSQLIIRFANMGVNFHFNPPRAPAFGGLWESNIRRTKDHLKRVVGDKSLTYDDLSTVLARIESCLNSRPLIPISDDAEDFTYLTPGHFLIGESLTSIPEPDLLYEPVLLSHRYRAMLKRVQNFWAHWKKDYLQSLQLRQKWLKQNRNLQIGDVVLIKDEFYPPLKWTMGRITETHPGADGLTRVCTVRTARGTYVRPIAKLAPLLTDETDDINSLIVPSDTSETNNQSAIMLPLFIRELEPTKPNIPKYTALRRLLNSTSKFSVIIEGNIGAGKTTLLKYFDDCEPTRIFTFSEPLARWTDFHGSNLLELLYRETSSWIFPFQSFAMLTMLQHHTRDIGPNMKVMERSIHSARYCFLEAHREINNIDPIKFEILNEWFQFIIEKISINIDLIIYLRASPDVILQRIRERNRPEEQDISIDYLRLLHQKHDDWILNSKFPLPAKTIILNGNNSKGEILAELENKIEDFVNNCLGGRMFRN